MSEEQTKVRKELIDLLDELNIGNFTINTETKQLEIHYKEDFDKFYPKIGAEPTIIDDKHKKAPYGATHFAHCMYKNWRIKGNVVTLKKHKANLSEEKTKKPGHPAP